MAYWHGYFAVERLNIGVGNWTSLQALFEAMGTEGSPMPAENNHWRTRPDGDAAIYESKFDADEVSQAAFKQLLADEFGVPVENILTVVGSASYAGGTTTIWTYYYDEIVPGEDRFKIERFGAGDCTWPESRSECIGYLIVNGWDQ